jgi:hypothetical protein
MTRALVSLFVRRMLAPEADDTGEAVSRLSTLVAAASGPGVVVATIGWVRLVLNLLMHDPDPASYARAVHADRQLLAALALSASGLATASLLDSLFPDPLDHASLGPLPLKSRVVLGARLVALFVPALLVTAAAAIPPGLLHAFAVASGGAPEGFFRNVAAIVGALGAASLTAFLVAAGAGSFLLVFGRGTARALTAPLQALLVVLAVLQPFGDRANAAPFVALHAMLLGHATHADMALVRSAGLVALVAAGALLAGFVASARRYTTGDFGPEADAPPRLLSRAASALLTRFGRSGAERQVLGLGVPTLTRSPRHRRTIVIYTAGGLALAYTGLVGATGDDPLLAEFVTALHLTSLALFIGLRTVFAMPLSRRPFETLRAMGGDEISAMALAARTLVAIVIVPLALIAGVAVAAVYDLRTGAGVLGGYALLGTALAWLLSRSFLRAPFAPGALNVEVPGATLGAALLMLGVYVGILPGFLASSASLLAPVLLPAGVGAALAALLYRGDAALAGAEPTDVSMHLGD